MSCGLLKALHLLLIIHPFWILRNPLVPLSAPAMFVSNPAPHTAAPNHANLPKPGAIVPRRRFRRFHSAA